MRLKSVFIALACTAAVLWFCPPVYSAQAEGAPELWKYMHPQGKFIAGVDWQRAKASPTGRMLARQLAGQAAKFKSSGPGLELMDQVDRVLISGTEPATTGNQGPAEMVIAVEGRLDRAALRKSLPPGTALERFKGIDLYVPPKSKPGEMLLAVLSDKQALLGDRESIALVLDAKTGLHDAQLAQRAADMASRCEIWLVSAALSKPGAGGGDQSMKQLEDIESMDLGVNLQNGLGVRMNLLTKNEESAKGLAMLAQLVSSMATQDTKQTPEVTNIIRSLKVTVEGTAVRASMDIPLAQLEKGVLQARSSAEGMGKKTLESFLGMSPSGQMPPGLRPAVKGVKEVTVQGQMVTLPPPAPPEPPKTRTIRIVGGDDGSKEITYTTGGPKH